jgi:hypothetical protein
MRRRKYVPGEPTAPLAQLTFARRE